MSAPSSTITENGTITSGIVLTSSSYTNPVTIAASAHITLMTQASYQYYAVSAATSWTVQNDGTLDASGDGHYNKAGYPYGGGGIALTNGGVVVNAASSQIDAYYAAVKISGVAGTVLNQGVIDSHGYGIRLLAGGSIDNAAGATVSSRLGNYIEGAHDVVTNEGSIIASASDAFVITDTGTYALVVNGTGGFIDAAAGYGIIMAGAGIVTNQGTVLAGSDAIEFSDTGTLNNNGFIYGLAGIEGAPNSDTDGPDIINNAAGGMIGGSGDGVYIKDSLTLSNQGIIIGKTGVGIRLSTNSGQTATVINAGYLGGADNALYVRPGSNGNLLFEVAQGSTISGDVVAFSGAGVTTTNILDLAASSGTAVLGTSFQNFNTIEIAPGTAWLLEGDSAAVAGGQTFAGFAASDTLDLTGVTFTAGETSAYTELSLNGPSYGYLAITNASGTYDINFSGLGGTPTFALSSDGHGGTDIVVGAVTCFCRGTLIRTARGEVAVEALAIGDLVATLSGAMKPVKWIGRRAYDGRMIAKNHLALPVCIKAGAIIPGSPARDLHVSPGHGIFVNGILVPAWRLVNGVSVTQAAAVEQVEYFHVELERHEVILAENCAVESFLEQEEYGLRALFQNAAEFHALYPGAAPDQPALPRADHGWQLQMAYRLLAARAGVAAPAAPQGPLRGFVDQDGPHIVSGWAQDCDAPEEPVALDILLNGARIANVLADIYRPDLRAAGLGSGCHGFVFACAADVAGDIAVRRSSDGAVLAVPGALARTRQAQAA